VLALRTTGVAFMIVTLMFAQVFYLTDPLFRRDGRAATRARLAAATRHPSARCSSSTCRPDRATGGACAVRGRAVITLVIVRSRFGRVLVAIRENEERTRMLGYNTFANKLRRW
jgi:branched-chain amino acid transport system permease protein